MNRENHHRQVREDHFPSQKNVSPLIVPIDDVLLPKHSKILQEHDIFPTEVI